MTRLFASVDLGGTYIKCAFADAEGNIKRSESVPTKSHEGAIKVLERMAGLITDTAQHVGEHPHAVGIGIPGVIDLHQGITKFLPNFPTDWNGIPVRETLEPKLGCPVYLLNDVRMATLGELTYGHGRESSTMVFLALGTGIGGGLVIEGRLRLGPNGAAAEIGHQTVLPDGPLCGCGNRGCVEALASGPAITGAGVRLLLGGQAPVLHEITGGDVAKVTTETMAEAVRMGEASVRAVVTKAADYIGIGIANMVTTLHPDLIVLGGGVAQMGEVLFVQIRKVLEERVRMVPTEDIAIKPSKLGPLAGTLGGIALAMKGGLLAEARR
ncbi:MAG: ROK family protein [Acidobacteriota bacterium]|nr:MAG: ROK family protein [Acidobacteriota bacterium]